MMHNPWSTDAQTELKNLAALLWKLHASLTQNLHQISQPNKKKENGIQILKHLSFNIT